MTELKNIFTPEKRPIHKAFLEIATHFIAEGGDVGKTIKAGTILKAGDDSNKEIVHQPEKGAKVAVAADSAKMSGVLSHDLVVTKEGKLPIGVMIEGVVYEDVMKEANGASNVTQAVISALKLHNITFYNVKTK